MINSILPAIPREILLERIKDVLAHVPNMSETSLQILNDTLFEFLARNHKALSRLLDDSDFVDAYPQLARQMLLRAIETETHQPVREILERKLQAYGWDVVPVSERAKATSQIKLTSSQQQVYEHMRAMVEIYLENPVRNGVRLRLNPLIIGQTGVGKSQIARKLGDDMGLKVIRCTIGDWVVSGANTKPNTMNTIQKAIRQDGCKLLVIDELDKLGSLHSAWSQALLVEVYNLIDRTVSTGDWSKSDLDRLNEEVAIVGAGTWAALWGRRTVQPVGFGSASAGREQSIEALVRRESIVPSELLNRFASPPLILEPYTVADFEEIAATLKLDPAVFDPVSAAASGLNFRAVESALGADAIRKFLAKKRPIPELQP